MKAICVDDSKLMLEMIQVQMEQIHGLDKVEYFSSPEEALEYVRNNEIDIAFLDIEMAEKDGIELSREIKEILPNCSIIFVTSEPSHKSTALDEKCKGYLMKPVSALEIEILLEHIERESVATSNHRMRVQCFGSFEVFIDGKPVPFKRKKTKELFAYLVDRKGARSTVREICAVVWEDNEDEKNSQAYLRKCISDMKSTFASYGIDNVLIAEHGAYSVNTEAFKCDYYDYEKDGGDPAELHNREYMSQYTWSEYWMQR